ncbi:MAG: phosphoribosylglycinamide synthetase [Panacagrimonas sp.]|nr:phosphoribosylglycinamide synthetase [Panacagrimonas sp.]
MRVLGVGDDHSLAALYLRLIEEGHALRVSVAHAESQDVMAGLVERCGADWRAQLPWIRAAGDEGLIVFETAHHGAEQDALRAQGFHVVGGSALGDALEEDRERGQTLLKELGLPVARTVPFADFHHAISFLKEQPGRYVYKVSSGESPSTSNYVGELDDGSDMVAVLQGEAARLAASGRPPVPFVLMEHVEGVETGVGAYFDGRRFLRPACIDWEHKRFFPGDLGELTGEMGTVVSFRGSEVMFARVLAPLEPVLREGGYHGWINVNTIVNGEGIWPLEFTCRFGYPGFAICGVLQRRPWGEVLRQVAHGVDGQATLDTAPGYAVGVVLTVPPFPWDEPRCVPHPIRFRGGEPDAPMRAHLHWAEVARAPDGEGVCLAGNRGYPLVVTGVDPELREAQRKANALAARVVIPNLRYRRDIGDGLMRDGLARLASWGICPATSEAVDTLGTRRTGGGAERPPHSTMR